jgi:hypothetical protein
MIDRDLLTDLQQLQTAAGPRVYFDTVPQTVTLPAIVIRRSGGERPRTLGGIRLFERSVFEIAALGSDHPQTYAIANAVRDHLDGYRGVIGSTRIRDARCIAYPDHTSEVTGDAVTRIATATYKFMHSQEE